MEEPKNGEWWMCQSTETLRMCPMVKTATGWGSIQNANGKPLRDYIQERPTLRPIYKMVRQSTAAAPVTHDEIETRHAAAGRME